MIRPGGVAIGLSLVLAAPVHALDCRLALVLALDVSGSMSGADDRLQRQGLAHALTAPAVVDAFPGGDPVALHILQWSGQHSQFPILDGWVMVDAAADLTAIAQVVANSQRLHGEQGTATGSALLHAAGALAEAPACSRQTVNVSSDGISNEGPEPGAIVHQPGPFDHVTVNALIVAPDPVEGKRENSQLVGWFIYNVLHGPEAFYILAFYFSDHERAMTQKLLRELEFPALS